MIKRPGDNTFSNYQEANRTFWRNNVIPLATRSARALADWLSPAYDSALTLKPDLDQIEALAPEREALWTRLEKASFLTGDEKRSAAGYGPKPLVKLNPYHDDRGRFDFSPDGGEGSSPNVATIDVGPVPDVPQADPSEWPTWDNPNIVPVQARPPTRTIQVGSRTYIVTQTQETDLLFSAARAGNALTRVGELDPEWRAAPELSAPQSATGAIASYRALAQEAEARIQVIERGNLPLGFNSHTL